MKVVSVVGTRPNFIKEYLINREFRRVGVEEILVHTGQHSDYEMSQLFFDQLALPRPDFYLDASTGSPNCQTAIILERMEQVLKETNPDVTLVYGDVTSTLAAALASARLRIPVAHVEAGVRSPARYNPEEINRRLTDQVSDLLFPPTKEAYENLIAERFAPEDVFLHGDIVKDTLLAVMREQHITPRDEGYVVVTIHRAENADHLQRLQALVEALLAYGRRCVFPVHPRTRIALERLGLITRLQASHIELCLPLGYLDFVRLLAGASKVITDSGGVRREAYILGKPVIIPVEMEWFPEMIQTGWARIVAPDKQEILGLLRDFHPTTEQPEIFGDGLAFERIVATMLQRYPKRNVGQGLPND